MSLATQLNELLSELLTNPPQNKISSDELIHCIDLTLLDDQAKDSALALLKEQAATHKVAAICVLPKHILQCKGLNIPVATVINFPHGNQDINSCLGELERSAQMGAKEIDYVLDYTSYLQDNKKKALNDCKQIGQLCKQLDLGLKFILETGVFPDIQSIYKVSSELLEYECDFLKTSTGKIAEGATLSVAFAMLSAIKDAQSTYGLKVSGGVKTVKQAQAYAQIAALMMGKPINNNWFRIGASSLLSELIV